jgi:hypothetical protein
MAPPAADAGGGLTGGRNENSVLFSLAALTKTAEERPAKDGPASSKDDSGLIDLKALAARTESMRPVAAKAVDGDVFAPPLGFTPPPIAAPMGALGSPLGGDIQPKSKLPTVIGAGAGIALLLVLGIVIGVKLAASSTPAPTAAPLPPPPASTAEPAASATAEPSATASASAAASASAPKKQVLRAAGGGGAKPAGGGGGGAAAAGGGGGAAAAGGATAGGGGATPPAAPKKGGDCGCNGDLMCLMKCSTSH